MWATLLLMVGTPLINMAMQSWQNKVAADAAKSAAIAKIKADYAAAMQALAQLKGDAK
jgi:hypothetical protein